MNYNLKLDLSKLQNVFACDLVGKEVKKKCICIPIEDNNIFVSERGGFYIDLVVNEMRQPSYGQTHVIKPHLPKDIYYNLTDEQKKQINIIGSLKPIQQSTSQETQISAPNAQIVDTNLPF